MINSEEIARIEQVSDKQRAIYLSMKERLEDMVRLMNMMDYGERIEISSTPKKMDEAKSIGSSATGSEILGYGAVADAQQEELIDTSDIYICTTEDGITDIFRMYEQQNVTSPDNSEVSVHCPEIRNVYLGLNSNKVAGDMRFPYAGGYAIKFFTFGERTGICDYVANTELNSVNQIETIRAVMKEKGLIPQYEKGRASLSELNGLLTILQMTSLKENLDWFISSTVGNRH